MGHTMCALQRLLAALALLPILIGQARQDHNQGESKPSLPIVINTWAFTNATEAAWEALTSAHSSTPALDAVERGCGRCEADQCDGTVGFGGSPDEAGETTLDALIMDGDSLRVGAVSDLRHIKNAIATARLVMERTRHSMLAGLQATQFAFDMGMPLDNLTTKTSADLHKRWKKGGCQPNFRRNVTPDPATSCGPYSLPDGMQPSEAGPLGPPLLTPAWPARGGHDTIALLAVDGSGSVAAGCSTNGAVHKVPGRVGDGSVPGGGAYADSEVGACGATGDGDVHLRLLPCYQVVESMRGGSTPGEAAAAAMQRIARRVGGYVGAVVAVGADGAYGAACHGWGRFHYSVRSAASRAVEVVAVDCTSDTSA